MDDVQAARVFNANNTNLASVAAQIRSQQVRALTPTNFEDVFVIMEYAQREIVSQFDELKKRTEEVAAREKAVTEREIKAAAHQRALDVAATAKGNRLRIFGRG